MLRNITITVGVSIDVESLAGPVDVVVDSTGLKVFGDREWEGQVSLQRPGSRLTGPPVLPRRRTSALRRHIRLADRAFLEALSKSMTRNNASRSDFENLPDCKRPSLVSRSFATLIRSACLCAAAIAGLFVLPLGAAAAEAPDFAIDVRPILSDRCFSCHGPATQESDLRLDNFKGATESVVVPGDADASELLVRVSASEDYLRMPPEESQKPCLTKEEIDVLRRWIDSGAKYEPHWAFAPIQKPGAPDPAAPIDSFLRARQDREGMSMRPEADRRTLIRRLTLDLTGLPPTLDEVAEFTSDSAPGAYECLVDRLLASPHFGEHMARFWLDAARYADTHGLHLDNYREIWPYRDWVVGAYNLNMPYDEFLIEQLAGDLLPEPSTDELVATGFNRCHVTTNEGGSIEQEVHTRNVFERVDAYGAVCLGLTVGCAKCHDHKYDPISQRDYYSLFAFFNSLDGPAMDGNRADPAPIVRVPNKEHSQRVSEAKQRLLETEAQLAAPNDALDAAQNEWQTALLRQAGGIAASETSVSEALVIGDWRHVGPFEDVERYLKAVNHGPEAKPIDLDEKFTLQDGTLAGWRVRPDWVDGQKHDALPGSTAANFLYRVIRSPAGGVVKVRLETDDGARVYLNGKLLFKKGADGGGETFTDQFELSLQPGRNELLVKLLNSSDDSWFNFKVLERPTAPLDALQVVGKPTDEWTDANRELLRNIFRARHAGDEHLAKMRAEREEAERNFVQLQRSTPTTLVFREAAQPKPAFVLERGQYDQQGEPVDRRTPPFLPPMPDDAPRDRLGLARWTVAVENPLTARVAVNRLWQQFFGAGLVATAEDFGSQGSPPTHPKLLNWLAADFVDSGWDVKRMIKLMVMTAAYRQDSGAPPEVWRRDPRNRLLARGPRFRLDGETLRDQALAVSGLLAPQLGGPPVKPPQPDGLWRAVAYGGSNTAKFVADTEPQKVHRRSLYTFHKRTSPPPQMAIFDGPTRETCVVRRERTNTPLQALLLMNDPQYVEAARALAERVLREESSDNDLRAAKLFELVASRPPTAEEQADLVAAVVEERAYYAERTEAAQALVSVGVSPPMEEVEPAELAAWTLVASTVLNLDEVVTKN